MAFAQTVARPDAQPLRRPSSNGLTAFTGSAGTATIATRQKNARALAGRFRLIAASAFFAFYAPRNGDISRTAYVDGDK